MDANKKGPTLEADPKTVTPSLSPVQADKSNSVEAVLLSAEQTAELLGGFSQSHLWQLHSQGRIPKPVKLGRRTLWVRAELLAYVEAGCPNRQRWEAMKQQRGNRL